MARPVHARVRCFHTLFEALESRRLLNAGGVNYGPSPVADPSSFDVHAFHFDYHNGITVQSDGKVLAAGYVGTSGTGTGRDLGIARYNADGTIDSSYGTNGVAWLSFAGDQESKAITLDASGNAVVAGTY